MAVVNDFLDFSKIEREKTELEIRTFNLRNCIEDALQSVAEKAASKRLDMAYIIDKISPDIIIGDPRKLRQILVNLLCNAVEFTDTGEVIVSVSSEKLDALYEIHFAVRDTGTGIPADKLGQLFKSGSKPCSLPKEPDTKKSRLADASLFISRELVELMSGRIWAESSLGEGSTFHFTRISRRSSRRGLRMGAGRSVR